MVTYRIGIQVRLRICLIYFARTLVVVVRERLAAASFNGDVSSWVAKMDKHAT